MNSIVNPVQPPEEHKQLKAYHPKAPESQLAGRVLRYLHSRKGEDVPERDVFTAAKAVGYSWEDVRRVLGGKTGGLLNDEPNIGMWWDSRERVAYLRWYDMEQEEYDARKKALLDF